METSDTPTSQSAAARWTFYRRLGLLLRTRLDDEGTTLSLSEVAARTHGRVSVQQLVSLLEQGALAQPDPVTCILLAQAFDVDPDFFVTTMSVDDYVASIRAEYANQRLSGAATLQEQAYAITRCGATQLASVH
jgi:transcriptional regulator with XRE-family HTH domain